MDLFSMLEWKAENLRTWDNFVEGQMLEAKPFNPSEWLASNFSSRYHPCITHQGHENKGNNHQLKKLLIVKHILLGMDFRKYIENSMENINTDVGV